MSATPPEASAEYSRAQGRSGGVKHRSSGRRGGFTGFVPAIVLGGGLLGAALLLVAEFTTLYEVHTSLSSAPIKSVTTGSHHAYALVPIAALVVLLAYAAWREGSRPALIAIGALGVITLLIALVGDLPDAQATGLVQTSQHFVQASSTPELGLYLETLGAAVLLLTSGIGLLLGAPAPRRPAPRRRSGPDSGPSGRA